MHSNASKDSLTPYNHSAPSKIGLSVCSYQIKTPGSSKDNNLQGSFLGNFV